MENDVFREKIQDESKRILGTINEMIIQLNEVTATAVGSAKEGKNNISHTNAFKAWGEQLINKIVSTVPEKQIRWVSNDTAESQVKIDGMTSQFFKKKEEMLKKTEKNVAKF